MAPARAKACNVMSFNRKFGCLSCLHPTSYSGKNLFIQIKQILNFEQDYINQVRLAESTRKHVYKGIKGFSYLSLWLIIPYNIIIDYLHLCLQGSFKSILMCFFDSKNNAEIYYLAKYIYLLDKRLLNVRLPIEIERSTRSINERSYYKANEWRTILFYLSIPLFKNILNQKAFYNLIKYVVFIRILCQDSVNKEEINDAQMIIVDFIKEFEEIYGTDSMRYNIHAHLHLPLQVWNYGPLNKCSCFQFENLFRISKDMFHGTRNFASQIAKNLTTRQINKTKLDQLSAKTSDTLVKSFISQIVHRKSNVNNVLLNEKKVSLSDLSSFERSFFINRYGSVTKTIHTSNRAIINRKSMLFFALTIN